MPHDPGRQIQQFSARPSFLRSSCRRRSRVDGVEKNLAFVETCRPAYARDHPLDVHTRVQGLATWQPQVAAFALRAGRVDFRVSPGRAAASTTRSRPPRSSGARSAAHAGHLSTRKCCVGRGGVGSERSAPAPQGALERACARLRTSSQPAELIGEPRAARATPGRAHRATPRRGQPARELVTSSAREQAAEGTT